MNRKVSLTGILKQVYRPASALLITWALLGPAPALLVAQTTPSGPAASQSTTIPPEQLDSLVAPLALYPDNLLAQVLVAATYPLEIVQLHQWLEKNKDLQKDQKKLTEKVSKQPWDPSIQAMAALPDVVKWLAEDITWTTDLGNAFLAQQKDVMAAVQRMRKKAQDKGALKSNEQIKVQSQTVESQQVIVIEQSNPQVVYVPSYDPVYVYGPPAYPYPPIYYPPYYGTGAAIAAGAIGFGIGVAVGAAWGGGWGWGCGWGGGDVDINVNNNFNRNTNIQGGNRTNVGGGNRGQGGKWQHNPSHRGGAPYRDKGTADRFGGTTRGDSLGNRQSAAQRDLGNRGNRNDFGNRGGAGDRGGAGNRAGAGDRGGAGVSDRSRGGGGDRGGSLGGSSNKMGSRDIGSSRGSSGGGFGGSGGWGGSSARSSSSRGMSSMSSSRGGGGFSGGSRGGGGGFSRGGGGGGGRRR